MRRPTDRIMLLVVIVSLAIAHFADSRRQDRDLQEAQNNFARIYKVLESHNLWSVDDEDDVFKCHRNVD